MLIQKNADVVEKQVRFRWPVRQVNDFSIVVDIPSGDREMYRLDEGLLCGKLGLTNTEYDKLQDTVFETIVEAIMIVK